MIQPASSSYIKQQRREYFLYTINSRAIPSLSDGLKPAQRRVLWTGRNGEKVKTATLAGATMPIHPHASPEDVISNMAGPWCNNTPLFTGYGAFGTMLAPTSYGAPRYTSVKVSDFTKDVLFRDIEIIPMQPNYDDTLEEPLHFLPLVPVILLNPTFGIAGGFQCNILPYDLKDIIRSQIAHLNRKPVVESMPFSKPIDCRAVSRTVDVKTTNVRYTFEGDFVQLNASEIQITKLPYGLEHTKFIDHLVKLEDDYKISSFDDLSKDKFNIVIRFPRGFVNKTPREDIIKLLKLSNSETDNMNVISFDGSTVINTNYVEVIQRFTDWRLAFFVNRYQRLLNLIDKDIQRYKDIILAIEKNVGSVAIKTKSKGELEDYLDYIGVVNLEYISTLSVYRFTQDEKEKTQQKLNEAEKQRNEYENMLSSEPDRIKVYITELESILKTYG